VTAPAFAIDTSCVIAAVCSWHEHHAAAAEEIERRLDRGEQMIVAAHVLLESYAVLTRLPPPHRLAPADARTLIRANFADGASVVTLNGPDHVGLLDGLVAAGIRGGRTYDALIAECAGRSGAGTLLTLNPRHFAAQPAMAVVDPTALT
jgi:predicted nucleic acid-binding protein